MRLIIGLGNPGKEYQNTRHNAGFRLVEALAERESFLMNKKFEAELLEKKGFLLVKPQTFMNESGRAVRKMMDFYKLGTDDVVVVHDDLDLKLGEYKIQKGVGPKVHNGVSSVEACLPSKDFWRVRLGVDNRGKSMYGGTGADYVLAKFSKEELEILDEVLAEAADELLITLSLE